VILEKRRENKKETFIDKIYWFFSKSGIFLKNYFLILFLVFITVFGIQIYGKVNSLIQEYEKQKQLKIMIKNLSASHLVGEVSVKGFDDESVTLILRYFDRESKDILEKEYVLKGRVIFIDYLVLNFDYHFVETGEKQNIALVNKIYSDSVSYSQGYDLLEMSLFSPELYGISEKEYGEMANYVRKLVNDSEYAKGEGVRSAHGSALSFRPSEPGDLYRIYVNQTGGIILEKIIF